jgi:hypothetical protein
MAQMQMTGTKRDKLREIRWFVYIDGVKIFTNAISENPNAYDSNVFDCLGKHLILGVNPKTNEGVLGMSKPMWCYKYKNEPIK